MGTHPVCPNFGLACLFHKTTSFNRVGWKREIDTHQEGGACLLCGSILPNLNMKKTWQERKHEAPEKNNNHHVEAKWKWAVCRTLHRDYPEKGRLPLGLFLPVRWLNKERATLAQAGCSPCAAEHWLLSLRSSWGPHGIQTQMSKDAASSSLSSGKHAPRRARVMEPSLNQHNDPNTQRFTLP